MSARERRKNSLSAKTFRGNLWFAVVIIVAAVTFGFFLYNDSVRREFRIETLHMSRSAALMLNEENVRKAAEAVAEVYDSLPEAEKTDGRDAAYLQKFASVMSLPEFSEIRSLLNDMRKENDAVASYVAMLDYDASRMIFIIDGDQKDSFCPPGSWDLIKNSYIKAFRDGTRDSFLDKYYETPPMQSVINRMEEYGYRCTAGTDLFKAGKYPVLVFFDTDMNRTVSVTRSFLLQYVILLAAVTAVSMILMIRRLQKDVAGPINALSEAAASYSREKKDNGSDKLYFDDLNIHTGDELEKLALTMKDMETDINNYEQFLTRATAEKEKIRSELNVARQIQEGILPHNFPPFPERREFDIYASMRAAKMVGGDFYDFFMIDGDHLAVVIADVSDKGIPAALFMMSSKILIENVSKINKCSPAEIISSVNKQICENNNAGLFLTVWLGILDIPSGILKAVNAGHEYPAVRHADGSFEIYKDKHNFVVGGMSDILYKDYEILLQPGDTIFQYTDGVTDASNSDNELFGDERMLAVLNNNPDAAPDKILQNMAAAIDKFAGETPQFDDITMLCLRYNGMERQKMENEVIWEGDAALDNLQNFLSFVETNLEDAECPMKTQMKIVLAAEEIFVNIASYAYLSGTGKAYVTMLFPKDGGSVTMAFRDNGVPFDPFLREDPDTTLSAAERKIGGLGIFMVKKTMDDVSYEYLNGQNVLTIRKNF